MFYAVYLVPFQSSVCARLGGYIGLLLEADPSRPTSTGERPLDFSILLNVHCEGRTYTGSTSWECLPDKSFRLRAIAKTLRGSS